ncbi:MAG TPA: PAC2 family protein [Candidatus Bathyarchaeota archaeon]|nr:PAC2 family protein [Candidatus Bathyarchaeota archaeon]
MVRILGGFKLSRPVIIMGFYGWPDAGKVASGSIKYLIEKWNAKKLAEIDIEEYYILTSERPYGVIKDGWIERIECPEGSFYVSEERNTILLIGAEPNIRWTRYLGDIIEIVERFGVEKVLTLGGVLDNVPYTGEPIVTGLTNKEELWKTLKKLRVKPTSYKGPVSIHSIILEEMNKKGLEVISLWGHVPYFIPLPNPKVTYRLVRIIDELLGYKLDLKDLQERAQSFERIVEEEISKDPTLKSLREKIRGEDERPFYVT